MEAAAIAEHLGAIEPDASAQSVIEDVYRLASDAGAGDNVAVIAVSARAFAG